MEVSAQHAAQLPFAGVDRSMSMCAVCADYDCVRLLHALVGDGSLTRHVRLMIQYESNSNDRCAQLCAWVVCDNDVGVCPTDCKVARFGASLR